MILSYALYFFLVFHNFPTLTRIAIAVATDFILLNCGAWSHLNDTSGRIWEPDELSRYVQPNAASYINPSILPVPYETVCVLQSPSSYSFHVSRGPKFLRVYFYPTTYATFDSSPSFLLVIANGFILLNNLSDFLNYTSLSESSFKKEFIINVQESQSLNVTFIPSANSFAFINGIEIVSLPDNLYCRGDHVPIKFVDQWFYLTNHTALESLYRLNVGDNDVGIQDDSGPSCGMFRAWSQDDNYIFGADFGYTPHAEDLLINYTDQTPPHRTKKNKGSSVIYPVIGSLIGVLAVVTDMSFLIFQQRRKLKKSLRSSSSIPLTSDLCRRFLLQEIKTVTSNFDQNFILGKRGFGNVYKGFTDNGANAVAIKRLNPSSNQGACEFLTEIEMLSKLRYLHVVSLIGYCDQNGEMILVYDYMAHVTLRDHLYNSSNSPLKWKQRLKICIGAAKGLCYLHTCGEHAIIHHDIKSTNILLDEKWVAKVSDFGLSKVGPIVSTAVKDCFGYVDPEYYRRQQLTDKSDVHSFGVVCVKFYVQGPFSGEKVNLAEWANFCYREGRIQEIIDPNLAGQIVPECLSKFVETAVMCLREKGVNRPDMNDVVRGLKLAMQLQQAMENPVGDAAHGCESYVGTNPSFSESSEAVSGFKGISLSTNSNEKLK
ncbi:Serine/threonine protein kinase [Handroanthus impetiginosus]|uniref:Serine/threonine protein kinase n=1 Tax=Handroanthus impetiginosus TaxID=429701 RepID=A0A2G9IBQ7_9LAMI|nr:Serine/threonine protein kinase [Handroanthus impetiginosus]